MKRTLIATAAACVALGAGAGVASATQLGQVNGQGLTHRGATMGYNAKSDLSGHLVYVSHDGSGFRARCDSFTSWQRVTSPDGYPRVRLLATCTDQDGTRVFMKAKLTDRGEPGRRDNARVFWSYTAVNASHRPFLADTGRIQKGNIQIHDPKKA